jgi:HK97 family phage major capsid protein
MDLSELRSARLRASEMARAIANRVQAEGRSSLTTHERADFDRHMAEAEGLRDRIAREERLGAEERSLATLQSVGVRNDPSDGARIGLSPADRRRYSLHRLIGALASRDFRSAGYELECSDAVARNLGAEPRGVYVPDDVLGGTVERRAVTKGGTGGSMIETSIDPLAFIDLLRAASVVFQAGATFIPNLRGDLAIPRRTAGATAQWLSESGTVVASDGGFDQVLMQPRTLAARTDLSRKMVLQATPEAEEITRRDLAASLGLEIDRAALFGSGVAPEPRGVANVVGIGSLPLGTDGAALTWADIVSLEGLVTAQNSDGDSAAYITNTAVRAKLKATERASGTGLFVWADQPGDSTLNGRRSLVSNIVPSDVEKGASGATLSQILFGVWRDLIIAQWGGLQITADPYTSGDAGAVIVRAFVDVDVAVRHAESFAIAPDVVTV